MIVFHAPPGHRPGPCQARRWGIWADNGGKARKEVISQDELICVVGLQNEALTKDSLATLAARGVPATDQPGRDSTRPPKQGNM